MIKVHRFPSGVYKGGLLPRMAMRSAELGHSKVQEGAALFHLLDNGDGEAT